MCGVGVTGGSGCVGVVWVGEWWCWEVEGEGVVLGGEWGMGVWCGIEGGRGCDVGDRGGECVMWEI